jgi:hypothetical protein
VASAVGVVDDTTAIAALDDALEAFKDFRGPAAQAAFARLDEQHGELIGALRWFVESRRPDQALTMASTLVP